MKVFNSNHGSLYENLSGCEEVIPHENQNG
jgi:hypothetical protein